MLLFWQLPTLIVLVAAGTFEEGVLKIPSLHCPNYAEYAASPHYPLSRGPLRLPFQRPVQGCRTFRSDAVEALIDHFNQLISDYDLARLFENCFPNTLDTTVRWHSNGSHSLSVSDSGAASTKGLHAHGFAPHLPFFSPLNPKTKSEVVSDGLASDSIPSDIDSASQTETSQRNGDAPDTSGPIKSPDESGQPFVNIAQTPITIKPQQAVSNYSTFIVTGDINAMWLRDSYRQVSPYIRICKGDTALQNLLLGLIATQAEQITQFPYCNAFHPPRRSELPFDSDSNIKDRVHPKVDHNVVFECKYELDSLASFFALSSEYFATTQDSSFVTDMWVDAVRTVLRVIKEQSQATYSNDGQGSATAPLYSFQRETTIGTETLPLDGAGLPVNANTSLIRSAFRPSDDASTFQFLIPANAMMAVALKNLAPVFTAHGDKNTADSLFNKGVELEVAIWKHGIFDHKRYGPVFAYEVDGYGGIVSMDDANLPSLLSLPDMGFLDKNHPIYLNTRRMIMSKSGNPYYLNGRFFSGIGGPHIGVNNAWPMSLLVAIRTSDDDDEIERLLEMVKKSTAQLGLMHESVHVDIPFSYTRSWFAWANSEFAKTLIDVAIRKPALIFDDSQLKNQLKIGQKLPEQSPTPHAGNGRVQARLRAKQLLKSLTAHTSSSVSSSVAPSGLTSSSLSASSHSVTTSSVTLIPSLTATPVATTTSSVATTSSLVMSSMASSSMVKPSLGSPSTSIAFKLISSKQSQTTSALPIMLMPDSPSADDRFVADLINDKPVDDTSSPVHLAQPSSTSPPQAEPSTSSEIDPVSGNYSFTMTKSSQSLTTTTSSSVSSRPPISSDSDLMLPPPVPVYLSSSRISHPKLAAPTKFHSRPARPPPMQNIYPSRPAVSLEPVAPVVDGSTPRGRLSHGHELSELPSGPPGHGPPPSEAYPPQELPQVPAPERAPPLVTELPYPQTPLYGGLPPKSPAGSYNPPQEYYQPYKGRRPPRRYGQTPVSSRRRTALRRPPGPPASPPPPPPPPEPMQHLTPKPVVKGPQRWDKPRAIPQDEILNGPPIRVPVQRPAENRNIPPQYVAADEAGSEGPLFDQNFDPGAQLEDDDEEGFSVPSRPYSEGPLYNDPPQFGGDRESRWTDEFSNHPPNRQRYGPYRERLTFDADSEPFDEISSPRNEEWADQEDYPDDIREDKTVEYPAQPSQPEPQNRQTSAIRNLLSGWNPFRHLYVGEQGEEGQRMAGGDEAPGSNEMNNETNEEVSIQMIE